MQVIAFIPVNCNSSFSMNCKRVDHLKQDSSILGTLKLHIFFGEPILISGASCVIFFFYLLMPLRSFVKQNYLFVFPILCLQGAGSRTLLQVFEIFLLIAHWDIPLIQCLNLVMIPREDLYQVLEHQFPYFYLL